MIYSDEIVRQVWERARVIFGFDPDKYRKDKYDKWIIRSEYGNRLSKLGWEIGPDDPRKGNEPENLIPLQWENYAALYDK